MRNPFIINPGGEWTLSADGDAPKFRKELIGEGVFQHPTRPWAEPLVVDEAYLNELAANTNAALSHGIRTPLPNKHTDGEDPEANRGFLAGEVEVGTRADGKRALYGVVEVTNPDTAQQIGRDLKDVSVYIDSFGSGDFTPEGDRIVHVALTNYPVYSDQENFVALSTGEGVSSIPVLREVSGDERTTNTMKITDSVRKILSARLGVTLAGDELTADGFDTILSALPEKADPAPAPTADDVPRLLSVDPSEDRYFSAYQKSVAESLEKEVTEAEKAGRLTKDMAESARTLLSCTHAYALDAEGKAEAVDVPKAVRAMLAGIPDKAVVNVDDRQGADRALSTVGDAPPVEAEKFDAEKGAEVANRMLSLIPGQPKAAN